jgi:predicted DNA repair protein MutK
MDAKRFVTATLAGGVAVLLTGYLIFALPPFEGFYAYAMNAGSATGVARESPVLWAVALGALSYSALIVFAIGNQARSLSTATGIKIGALVGFLVWFTADFMFYGISHVGNLTSTVVDPLLELVPGAVAGGVIALVIGMGRDRR